MGLSENVFLEKAFSDNIRSGFLVPYQKSRFLISFSNSVRSGQTIILILTPLVLERASQCIFSSLDCAARSGARVQYLPKLKAVPRYDSARIYMNQPRKPVHGIKCKHQTNFVLHLTLL